MNTTALQPRPFLIQPSIESRWEYVGFMASLKEPDQSFRPVVQIGSVYEVFRAFLTALVYERALTLVDADFSEEELQGLIDLRALNEVVKLPSVKKISSAGEWMSLADGVDETNAAAFTLFTSGSTGRPKQVTHRFESLGRGVRRGPGRDTDVWGFAYNPTHVAGVQVLLQAALNGNPIVYLFDLSPEEVAKAIANHAVTHLSATPTFYRLLSTSGKVFHHVTHVTSGGERFDETLGSLLRHLFPQARILNVYASTEAGSVLAADGDAFRIRPELTDLVRIEQGELLFSRRLLGVFEGDMENEWYRTGDLVEVIDADPLRFRILRRQSDLINVGGYKVNPHEVEQALRKIPGIRDARVYGKSNSVTGSIVCAEVFTDGADIEVRSIRQHLSESLQSFKIPRVINRVEALGQTRTGKLSRIE